MLTAMQIKNCGALDAKSEADLKADAVKSSKAPGVKKITYLGAGR